MIFRLTLKVRKQLNIEKIEKIQSPKEINFFSEWYVNITYINHKKYFIFTESKTLFSIIKHAKGINSLNKFEKYTGDIFAEIFNDLIENLNLKTFRIENCTYASTENNYIRKAQTDHIYHAKALVEEGKNTFDVNRIPIASIGYKFPVDYFIDELGNVLGTDAFFIPSDLNN